MYTTRQRARRLAIVVMLSCAAVVCATTSARASPPSVVPPSARPHGSSYAEWSARWWQWAFSTEATATGPFGEDAVDCGVNQPSTKVWFLAGPFNASGTVERTCAVPVGTMLLVPVINVECSNLEAPPFFGATPTERADCVEEDLVAVGELKVTVDGKQVNDLERFAVTSPDFAFTSMPDNPVGVVRNGFATSRGVFVMLTPLAPRSTHGDIHRIVPDGRVHGERHLHHRRDPPMKRVHSMMRCPIITPMIPVSRVR